MNTLHRRIVRTLAALVVTAVLGAASRQARAYPQFQFSSGTSQCSQCHYAPAGGGLITDWGRSEAGDTISRGGEGAFLHGAWSPPSWLALGADVRLAALRNDVGGAQAPEYAAFPMQSDAYAHVALPAHLSVYVQAGVRGDVGRDESVNGRLSSVTDRFISNEHYVMWRPSASGPYLRAGRFFAPFGLRFVEHIFYVQRYTGYDLYNETYTVSGGYMGGDWELHVSLFTPPPESFPLPLQSVGVRESGGAAYGEKRFADRAAVALQARLGVGGEATRYQAGAIGKLWVDRAHLLFLGEADFIRLQVPAASAGENQFVSYLGATYFPVRGLMAGLAYERFQEDLSLGRTAHDALDVELSLFPWAHFELLALGRFQFLHGATSSDGDHASLGMLQFHYYL